MTSVNIAELIVGESSEIARLRELIVKIAPRRDPVLIQGPTGSGKELVAQALHLRSGRSGRLVPFNVCAIPDTMFEDALFGHVRGAFTGAAGDSQGYLLEADKGTAFFDEVSGLSTQMQVKLLRAIETGEFRPVGARLDRRSDFRVIAALNEPLPRLLESGRFRQDLAHRLATFVLDVPPLAARAADIAVLARFFAANVLAINLPFVKLSNCAIRALEQYDWPGNVRELRNVIHATVALSDSPTITGSMIVATLSDRGRSIESAGKFGYQRRELIDLLNQCAWDTTVVAERLGVDRATVYRRMTTLEIPTLFRSGARRRADQNVSELTS
jgi:DNA-binding NtrC family response regulator